MATLEQLVDNGVLIKFDPILDVGEQIEKLVYLTPEAAEWVNVRDANGEALPKGSFQYALKALLTDYCTGRLIYRDAELRWMKSYREHCWEFKTGRPNAVRLFGWFYLPRVFVGSHCEFKSEIAAGNTTYGDQKRKIIAVRDALDLDPPKVTTERNYDDIA